MTRTKLLTLQVLVGLTMLAIWHVLTVYPILGQPKQIQFFFSTPVDVLARVWKLFATGEIWRHLYITLVETILAFVTGAVGGILFGFLFARRELLAAVFDPYIKAANALPRAVLPRVEVAVGKPQPALPHDGDAARAVLEIGRRVEAEHRRHAGLVHARDLGLERRAGVDGVIAKDTLSWAELRPLVENVGRRV